ncbi:MAG TPA: ABC transporter substrate-binding protein [Verrucomicrobiae bacterium]|nr:ABC transporter substrate-binding protein [Verrucomicrobiae bacterium]
MRPALAIICAFLVFFAAEVRAASAPTKVVIAHAAMNARVAPLWIAEDNGFFAKYGVPVSTIFIRQAPILVAALTAGDVKIGYTGGSSVLAAVMGGADLKMIATLTNKLGYDLVAAPSVKSPKDLRGKRFGVQSIGGTLWMAGMLGLEHVGIDPVRDDVKVLVIGDQTVLAQALEAGHVDATVLDGVFSRKLKQKGFTILSELYDSGIPFSGQALVVRAPYLQEQRATLENVLKGLLEGIAFTLAPKNKAQVIATITRRLKLSDAAVAEEGYADIIKNTDRKPYPGPDGLRNIQRFMKLRTPAAEKIKLDEVIDDRILKSLEQSGFIARLYESYGVKN